MAKLSPVIREISRHPQMSLFCPKLTKVLEFPLELLCQPQIPCFLVSGQKGRIGWFFLWKKIPEVEAGTASTGILNALVIKMQMKF